MKMLFNSFPFLREEEERRILFHQELRQKEEKPYRGYGARRPVIHKRKPAGDAPKLLDGLVSRIQPK